MTNAEAHAPAADSHVHETVALAPVSLTFSKSSKTMAQNLRAYAAHVQDLAAQLEARKKGQKLHVQIVHRYDGESEVTHRTTGKGGTIFHTLDCNGGGDNGGGQ